MTPNHELFVKVLAQIEQHPETWDQQEWRCETGMCFAGWTTTLAGVEWRNLKADDSSVVYEGRQHHCSDVAAVLLGIASLTDEDALSVASFGLFAGENTLDDLYRCCADILGIDETVLRDKVRAEVA